MTNNIRKFRKELRMSQAELAVKSGVSRTILSGLESGKNDVTTTTTLFKIADALNKPVWEVFFAPEA